MDNAGQCNTREHLIKQYFHQAFTNKEILCALLLKHNINLSLRHLKRLLKKMGLRRSLPGSIESPVQLITEAIVCELQGSGCSLGYRAMWHRLVHDYKLYVKRKTVLELLWQLDPEGVQQRKSKRLRRRVYTSPGPSHTWHLDGYDKLKPFGLCIHGAIDGYSRKILWLEVGPTNNDPQVIAGYFMECVADVGHIPGVVRCDQGTEHTTIEFLQPFLHETVNGECVQKTFMVGKSTSNQRIEAWWSILRKQLTGWWINYFKDLRDNGSFCDADNLQRECLKFCFTRLLQKELDSMRIQWNMHIISTSRNAECPRGKPDLMFDLPEMYGSRSYGTTVAMEDIVYCVDNHTRGKQIMGCSDEFIELVTLLKPGTEAPRTRDEAMELYKALCEQFKRYSDD